MPGRRIMGLVGMKERYKLILTTYEGMKGESDRDDGR
jgi:hypothetical protein